MRPSALEGSSRTEPFGPTSSRLAVKLLQALYTAFIGSDASLVEINPLIVTGAGDLLALDVDVSSLLPPDAASYGFDNIGDVLGVSPVLLERYIGAARRISATEASNFSSLAHSHGSPYRELSGLMRAILPLLN